MEGGVGDEGVEGVWVGYVVCLGEGMTGVRRVLA